MAEVIKEQLSACVASYRQIIEFFALTTSSLKYNYDNKDDESTTVSSFLEARINIISALMSLNSLLSEVEMSTSTTATSAAEEEEGGDKKLNSGSGCGSGSDMWVIGRLCLAPRLFDGVLDVCVVTDLVFETQTRTQAPTETDRGSGSSSSNSGGNSSSDVSDPAPEHVSRPPVSDVVIHWVYPRNVYELRSSGMTVSVMGSRNTSTGSNSSSSGSSSGLQVYTQTLHAEDSGSSGSGGGGRRVGE